MDLSIKQRLALGFGCVLVLMGVSALLVGDQLGHTVSSVTLIVNSLLPESRAANTLAVAVDQQRTGLRAYILSGQRRHYDEYELAVAKEKQSMMELRRRLKDPRDQASLNAIEAYLAELHQDQKQMLGLLEESRKDEAYRYHSVHIRPLTEEIETVSNSVSDGSLQRIQDATDRLLSSVGRLQRRVSALFVSAFLIAFILVVATVRSVTGASRNTALFARAIADGDYDGARKLRGMHSLDTSDERTPRDEQKQIALALMHMARSLERREHILSAHASIGATCASSIDLNQLVGRCLEEIARHSRSQVAAVYLTDSEGRLSARGSYGLPPETAEAVLTGPEGLVEQATKSGKPVVLTGIPETAQFVIQPGLGRAVPASMACIPMVVEGRTFGVIALGSLYEYDSDTISLLETAASQIGVALSNAMRHSDVLDLATKLQASNEQLDAQNEELQCQNEEIQAQNEEIQTQNEELAAQRSELQEHQQLLRQALDSQTDIARRLQESFLPEVCPSVTGYEFADVYFPAETDAQVGGDFYDIIELDGDRLGIVMADVSGKGIQAAVYTAMVKYMLRAFAHEDHDPASVLHRLNRTVTNYVQGEVFITLFYGILHTADGRLIFANAGHDHPLLCKSSDRTCIPLESTGTAIGVVPDVTYECHEVQMSRYDTLVLYTDGITETRRGKAFLGQAGLEEMVAEMATAEARAISDHIIARTREYSDRGFHDDVAVLVVKSNNGA